MLCYNLMSIISSPNDSHPLTLSSSSFTLQWYVSTRSLATGRWPPEAANISGVRPPWGLGGTWSIQYTANKLNNTINVGVLLDNTAHWLMWEHMSTKWDLTATDYVHWGLGLFSSVTHDGDVVKHGSHGTRIREQITGRHKAVWDMMSAT